MARGLPLPTVLKTFFRGSLGYGHYIFALTFLLRLLSLSRLTASPFLLPAGSDMHFYDQWAKEILSGHWTDYRAFYGLPLYAYGLALIYEMFGSGLFVPGLIQAGLDAGTAVLIYKICVFIFRAAEPPIATRHVHLSTVAAVGCAVGWTLFVPAQGYSIILMPTAAAVFVFWFLMCIILNRETAPLPRHGFIFGLVAGFAAMGAATSLVLIPLALAALFTKWPRMPRRTPATAALVLAGALAGSSPCWVHNFFIARDPVFLSAHGGINFWLGNNPEAAGYPSFPGLHAGQSELLRDSIETAEAASGRELKRSEVSNYWSAKARSYIAANPGAWSRLMARKIANFWNAFEYDDLGVIRNLGEHGVLFPGLHFGVVAIFGLAGLLFVWNGFTQSRWIAAAIALQMLAILPVFVTERYRLVVVPGLLILAALGLARLWDDFARGAYRHAGLQLVAIAGSAFLVTMPRHDPTLWALEAYNAGRLALELNDLPRAQRELQRAHNLVPENAETNFALGNLRFAQGDTNAAKNSYQAALKADPKHKGALNNLGVVALNENAPGTAAEYFRRSLVLRPLDAKTHYLLAKALLGMGNRVGAKAALDRALELTPDQPEFVAFRDELQKP